MPAKIYQSKILEKIHLTKNIINLKIERPKDFKYEAGQFIQFNIPDPENKEKKHLRAYSICSTPADPYLEFCIKLVPNGQTSAFLNKLQTGDSFSFQGPNGRFFNHITDKSLFFIATGVGVAPLIGMIKDELKNKKNTQAIHLLFGLREEKDIFWTKEFENIKQNYKNFDYHLTLSQPSKDWTGLKERVTSHLPEKVNSNTRFYLCGSMPMIKEVRSILEERGAEKNQIHFEIF